MWTLVTITMSNHASAQQVADHVARLGPVSISQRCATSQVQGDAVETNSPPTFSSLVHQEAIQKTLILDAASTPC